MNKREQLEGKKIVVIGAGFAGLMFTSAVKVLYPDADLRIFDQSGIALHLQQGNSTRFVQPHIYDWPDSTARYPRTMFPFLNWVSGEAGAVAKSVLTQWNRLKIEVKQRRALDVRSGVPPAICWEEQGRVFEEEADLVVLAVGFGLEQGVFEGRTSSYWNNDSLNQPHLGKKNPARILVSGYGDGGLIDAIRAKISDFNHARFTYSFTDNQKQDLYEELRELAQKAIDRNQDWNDIEFSRELVSYVDSVVRDDTDVFFNARKDWFKHNGSALINRVLLALMFKMGKVTHVPGRILAEEIKFDAELGYWRVPLKDKMCRNEILVDHVVVRHGTDKPCEKLIANDTIWTDTVAKWKPHEKNPKSDVSSKMHYLDNFLVDEFMRYRCEIQYELAYICSTEAEAASKFEQLKKSALRSDELASEIKFLGNASSHLPWEEGHTSWPWQLRAHNILFEWPDANSLVLIVRTRSRTNLESLFKLLDATPYYSYGVEVSKEIFEGKIPERVPGPYVPLRFPGSGTQLAISIEKGKDGKEQYWFRLLQRCSKYGLCDAHNLLSVEDMLSIMRLEWSLDRMRVTGWRLSKSFSENLKELSYF